MGQMPRLLSVIKGAFSEVYLAQVPSGTFCIVQSKGSADRCCIMSDDSGAFVLHSFEWGESIDSYLHWGS